MPYEEKFARCGYRTENEKFSAVVKILLGGIARAAVWLDISIEKSMLSVC